MPQRSRQAASRRGTGALRLAPLIRQTERQEASLSSSSAVPFPPGLLPEPGGKHQVCVAGEPRLLPVQGKGYVETDLASRQQAQAGLLQGMGQAAARLQDGPHVPT